MCSGVSDTEHETLLLTYGWAWQVSGGPLKIPMLSDDVAKIPQSNPEIAVPAMLTFTDTMV